MTGGGSAGAPTDHLDQQVRTVVFARAADTARVPQAAEIAGALGVPQPDVEDALRRLAAGRALILAPGATTIWTANPFSAVPTAFRVRADGRQATYWGVCIWDALGVLAALHTGGTVTTQCGCGTCGAELVLTVSDGRVAAAGIRHREAAGGSSDGGNRGAGGALAPVVHFGVPAARWWENIVFT